MKTHKHLISFNVVAAAFMVAGMARTSPAQIVVENFYCVPSTCLEIVSDVGFFSVSIYDAGGIYNPGWMGPPPNPRPKNARQTLYSNGCTLTTNLSALGYTTQSPLQGEGIIAYVSGDQGGPQLIEITRAVFWASSSRAGPAAVPCQ
jgi:hypothetical protein